ncbi:MAG: trypsin-like serine protease [Bryobacterales bacterium]|nr:trypsin-like serine protease [Bryobacterales bacterium]
MPTDHRSSRDLQKISARRRTATLARRLAALALVASAPLLTGETIHNTDSRGLSNGTLVSNEQVPFLAFIEITHPRYHYRCLGTLIARNWLATAAHCVDEAQRKYLSVKHIQSRRELGGIARSAHEAGPRHVAVHLHPNWLPIRNDRSPASFGQDIALLKLPKSLSESEGPPARVLSESEALTIQDGLHLRTIGLTPGARRPAYAEWPVWSHRLHPALLMMRTDVAHSDPGDSGGPTLLRVGRRWVLAGIHAGGNSTAALAASVGYHRRWILATIEGTEIPAPPAEPTAPDEPPTVTLTGRSLRILVPGNRQNNPITCTMTTGPTSQNAGQSTVRLRMGHLLIECRQPF